RQRREPQGHRADAGGDGRGRGGHQARGVRRGAPPGRLGPGQRAERRGRHPRAPHAGPARRVHHPAPPQGSRSARHGARWPPGDDRRGRAAQPGRPVQRAAAEHPRRRGDAGRAAYAAPAGGRHLALRGQLRPGQRAAEERRGDDAQGPAGADDRRLLPQRARVQPAVRAGHRADGAAARARHRHAPRADEPGGRDRGRGGRFGSLDDRGTGGQRGHHPDGGPVPAARRHGIPGDGGSPMTDHDSWLLRGVIVPGHGEQPTRILVDGGSVSAIGPDLDHPGAKTLDADGLIALPGLVDLHTHLREPGREDAETVETGTAAAALGGYTAVHAMANTDPVADTAGVVEQVWRLGRTAGHCDVQPVGAVTIGLNGARLAELGTMADSAARVRVFSDDGRCVSDPLLMRRALEYVKAFDGVIAQHVGSALQVCHVSTAGSADIIRWAKSKGWPVTAEVTPHHLLLTDELAAGYDPVFKVNPPLRTEADVAELRRALADGTIDCVATDHAPHPVEAKESEWAEAAFGMTGLETALRVVQRAMVETGLLDWAGVADRMSVRPARIGRLTGHGRPLTQGAPGHLTLYDPAAPAEAVTSAGASKSRNTPFAGMELPGRVVATFLRGVPAVLDGKLA